MNTNQCKFYVKRKKRCCRMTTKNGNEYCGEHMGISTSINQLSLEENCLNNECSDGVRNSDIRILCPLDNSHSCYKSKLQQHLKVCNVKRLNDKKLEYIVTGINRGDTHLQAPKHIPISNLDQNVIDSVIEKIVKAHEKLPKIEELIYKNELLENEINNPTYGNYLKKHLIQNSSLLTHLDKAGLAKENTCFIEFGAGKGKLTYWLAQMIKDLKDSTVLLIDRSSHRHKNDNKLKNEQCPINVVRIRADIGDLVLSKVTDVTKCKHKVGIAKHLCGSATDLMIRCLSQLNDQDPSESIIGIIIAFCCHHRCEYIPYVGKNYLNSCGFTPDEFPILSSIASWATCGTGKNRFESRNSTTELTQSTEQFNCAAERKAEIERRESIGRKAKSLLNWGRLQYLMAMGFNCSLYYYTTREVSPENVCIIATRKIID